jgi:hypothetical protein
LKCGFTGITLRRFILDVAKIVKFYVNVQNIPKHTDNLPVRFGFHRTRALEAAWLPGGVLRNCELYDNNGGCHRAAEWQSFVCGSQVHYEPCPAGGTFNYMERSAARLSVSETNGCCIVGSS